MKKIFSFIIIVLLTHIAYAQDDNLTRYIERANKFNSEGNLTASLATWDLYLKEVLKSEEDNSLHYFMGIVCKSGVLIEAERFEEAEEILLAAKMPSEGDLRLNLAFIKNLAACAYNLNKYEDAISLYIEAYNTLLEYKGYYPESNDSNSHWCWSDELCFIAIELANVYVALNLYEEAHETFIVTVNSTREDWEVCMPNNRAGLYRSFFGLFANVKDKLAIDDMNDGNYEGAKQYFDELMNIVSLFPESKFLDYKLGKYLIKETSIRTLDEALNLADRFIELSTATSLYYYNLGYGTFESFCDEVALRNTTVARAFEEMNLFEIAENYFKQAIDVYANYEVANENMSDTYLDMANFQQTRLLDYNESLKYHFKNFTSLIQVLGKDSEKVFNAFDLMATEYNISLLMLDQLGIDGMFSVIDTTYADFNISYEDAQDIINQWRNILKEIESKYGSEYISSLLDYYNKSKKEYTYQYSGHIDNSSIVAGSLPENYSYEVRLNVYFDNLGEYINSLENFRTTISTNSSGYYEYICDISRTLENKNYIEWTISLLSEEIKRCLDENNMKLSEMFQVDIIETSLRYGLQNVAWEYIINDIAFHEVVFGPYDEKVPSYIDAETYVDKLFAFAWAYQSIRDYDSMLKYTRIVDAVLMQNKIDRHNVQQSRVYRNYSHVYYDKKDYKKALEYQLKSLNEYGVEQDYMKIGWPVMAYHELAEIYLALNQYDEAIDILNQCIEHCKLPVEGVDRIVPFVYGSLIGAYQKIENYEEMSKAARNMYLSKKSYFLDKTFGMWKDNITELYYGDSFPILLECNSAWALKNPLMSELCYDIALNQKGFLLNYESNMFDNVQNSGDDELKNRYNLYRDAVKAKSDSLWYFEGRFLGRYSEHEEFKEQNSSITWSDVQHKLGANDLAIEFTVCYKDETNSYAAILLKKDWSTPIMVELCEESELKKVMVDGANLYKENNKAYSYIWRKLEPYFKKGDNVYFAPHGLIHQINIEVLYGDDNKPMNQKCNLYRMSTTGNIIKKSKHPKYVSATLYGGLNYDTDTTSLLALNRNYHSTSFVQYGRILNDSTQTRAGWSYLPGTAREVESVRNILEQNKVTTAVYTDISGTEESFKALSGKSTPVIHIATHGFYLEDKKARRVELFNAFNDNETTTISPLKRSGLMFSGGQHAWLGRAIPDGIDDGVLTAEEIAGMNLSDTDLLVLSACQTGLGEITNEGVDGLQRGFKIAGVNTIIMSLWEVSDAATEVLMTKFYTQLAKGKSKRESFTLAIEAVKKEFPSPEYWAAFIMLD